MAFAERFDGRMQCEVLRITIDSHRDLKTLLTGFNPVCNRDASACTRELNPKVDKCAYRP